MQPCSTRGVCSVQGHLLPQMWRHKEGQVGTMPKMVDLSELPSNQALCHCRTTPLIHLTLPNKGNNMIIGSGIFVKSNICFRNQFKEFYSDWRKRSMFWGINNMSNNKKDDKRHPSKSTWNWEMPVANWYCLYSTTRFPYEQSGHVKSQESKPHERKISLGSMCKQSVVHMKILGKTCPLLGYTIMFQNSISIQTLEGRTNLMRAYLLSPISTFLQDPQEPRKNPTT